MFEFERSFVEALVIVLAVSFLSLGWRTGIVVALSVPLVLAIVFVVMYALGIDLHRITLGALIIALGLLVDDAIIAVEMMVVKIEQGWSKDSRGGLRLAVDGLSDADRHPRDGRRLSARGLRAEFGSANMREGNFHGRRHSTGRVMVRGRDLHPLPRGGPAASLVSRFEGECRRRGRLPKPGLQACCAGPWRSASGGASPSSPRRSASSPARSSGSVTCRQQFFPLSERPELFFQLRLPAGTAIGTTTAAVEQAETLLGQHDPDIATLYGLCRSGQPALLVGLESGTAQRSLRRDRDRRERHGSTRTGQGPCRESRGGRRPAAGAGSCRQVRLRTARRLPGPISRDRARPASRCARSPTRCATPCGRTRT